MILGRVVGTVVATVKVASMHGQKLLRVAPESPTGDAEGDELIAIDGVGAGVGERVLLVVEGRAASAVVGQPKAAIDAAVVAIVDRVDL